MRKITTLSPCALAVVIITVLLTACTQAATVIDPWAGCPEEKQCLSGDIVSQEAKSCCGDAQVCFVDNPKYGGSCISEEDAEARRAARTPPPTEPPAEAPPAAPPAEGAGDDAP